MRAGVLAAVLTTAAVAAGCSDGGADTRPPHATSSASTAPSAAQAGWSPCDGLTAASVSALVGDRVRENDGSSSQPRCTFTPVATGGAAYDLSYLWFDGGLEAALDAMGAAGSQLRSVQVPGADAARLVVRASKDGVLVTGFVQTGGLVQSVNAAQLAPYRRTRVVAGTTALLGELARQAPASQE